MLTLSVVSRYWIVNIQRLLLQTQLVVHVENNTPFLTVTRMTRVIEVSHWGNIAIEETYDISHSGAVLKGPFSRFDYQRHQDGASSVKSFKVSNVMMLQSHQSLSSFLACNSKARFPLPELTARVDGWPVSITRQHGPCWRAVNSASGNARRQHGPCWLVMETGHPSTRAVKSGSGNRT